MGGGAEHILNLILRRVSLIQRTLNEGIHSTLSADVYLGTALACPKVKDVRKFLVVHLKFGHLPVTVTVINKNRYHHYQTHGTNSTEKPLTPAPPHNPARTSQSTVRTVVPKQWRCGGYCTANEYH